jgi:HEPN domain-containing protein
MEKVMMHKRLTIAVVAAAAVAVAAACNQDPAGISPNELMLAQNAQLIAQDVASSTRATHEGWVRRLLDTLRTTDDPEARAFLEQARDYNAQARAAFEAGDREAARDFARLAFRAVLSAVIEVYPNAPERTGLAVDNAITRIESFLGDRDAPRIRRILEHVKELRVQADAALGSGDKVTALALNARGIQILHRLVEHVRDSHRDHDDVADQEMESAQL